VLFRSIKKYIDKNSASIPERIGKRTIIIDSGINKPGYFISGNAIDVLFGLLYLGNNFNVNLALDFPLTRNLHISKYALSLGIDTSLQFLNFQILWMFQHLFFPSYFDIKINYLLKNPDTKFIVIPLGIQQEHAHANILVWDVKNHIIERFEPNGANYPRSLYYNPSSLDQQLKSKFIGFDSNIKYLTPSDFLPTIGFQQLETLENEKCTRIGDPDGYCLVWCTWWAAQRLTFVEYSAEKLAKLLFAKIRENNISFKAMIRNFGFNITQIRDLYLARVKLDINDITNFNYTIEDLNKIEKNILENIQ
jgi:hypothetical protein